MNKQLHLCILIFSIIGILISTSSFTSLFAQSTEPKIELLEIDGDNRILFGNKKDDVTSIFQDYQGNIVISANIHKEKKQCAALLFFDNIQKIKTLEENNIIYLREFDGCNKTIQLLDGTYLVLAYKETDNGREMYLVYVKGKEITSEFVGTNGTGNLTDVIQTKDGHIVAVGYKTAKKQQPTSWILKRTPSRTNPWANQAFDFEKSNNKLIAITEGQDYYTIVGEHNLSDTIKGKIIEKKVPIFLRIAHDGSNYESVKIYGDGERLEGEPTDIVKLPSGGYAIFGNVRTKITDETFWKVTQTPIKRDQDDGWIILVDEKGTLSTDSFIFYNAGRFFNSDFIAQGILQYDGKIGLVGHTQSAQFDRTKSRLFYSTLDFSKILDSSKSDIPEFNFQINDTTLHYVREKRSEYGRAICQLHNGNLAVISKKKGVGLQLVIVKGKENPIKTQSNIVASNHQLFDLEKRPISFIATNEKGYLSFILNNKSKTTANGITIKLQSELMNLPQKSIVVGQLLAQSGVRVGFPIENIQNNNVSFAKITLQIFDLNGNLTTKEFTVRLMPPNDKFAIISWESTKHRGYINNETNVIPTTKTNQECIKFSVISELNIQKTDIEIIVNGSSQSISKSGEVTLRDGKRLGKSTFFVETCIENLQLGKNEIIIKVHKNGQVVSSETLPIIYVENKPNLYVLSIGITYDSAQTRDLEYTDDDALDLTTKYKYAKNDLKQLFNFVTVEALVGGKATASKIRTTILQLQAGKDWGDFRDEDIIILHISGHGKMINNRFKILAANYNKQNPDLQLETSVDYQENIVEKLAKIKGKKIILLDACFSGGASTNNVNTTSFTTFASSRSDEKSQEDDAWKNGAFTEAILEALNNGTDKQEVDIDNNKQLTLEEIINYVQKRVPIIVKEVKNKEQHPIVSDEKLDLDTPIYILK